MFGHVVAVAEEEYGGHRRGKPVICYLLMANADETDWILLRLHDDVALDDSI